MAVGARWLPGPSRLSQGTLDWWFRHRESRAAAEKISMVHRGNSYSRAEIGHKHLRWFSATARVNRIIQLFFSMSKLDDFKYKWIV